MPFYNYHCPACDRREKRLQTVSQMEREKHSQRCVACESAMEFGFQGVPHVVGTDTLYQAALNRHSTDGFKNKQQRAQAHAAARAAGVSTSGKRYCPQLARYMNDPRAWVGHRDDVERICREDGHACEGVGLHIKGRPVEEPPHEPFVAEHLVEQHTDAEVVRTYANDVTPKERAQLKEEVRKRISPRPLPKRTIFDGAES